MFMLDTNVVSEFSKLRPSPKVMDWINGQDRRKLFISAIVKTEIEYGVFCMPDGKKKQAIDAAVKQALSLFKNRCLPFDEKSSAHCAAIRVARKNIGRRIETPDAMIAAIARQHGFSIVTRNAADFAGIDNLTVVNPWQSAAKI